MILDGLLAQPYDLSMADRYLSESPAEEPWPALSVGVDPERGVGGLAYQTAEGRWFSRGQDSKYDEVVYCYYGNAHEFPRDSETPPAQIRVAVVEFLETGGARPESIGWQAGPTGWPVDSGRDTSSRHRSASGSSRPPHIDLLGSSAGPLM